MISSMPGTAATLVAGLLVAGIPSPAAAAAGSASTTFGTVTVTVADATWHQTTQCQDLNVQVSITGPGSDYSLTMAGGHDMHLSASRSTRPSLCVSPQEGSGTFTLTGQARVTSQGVTQTAPILVTFTMTAMPTEVSPWPWVFQGLKGKVTHKAVSGSVRGINSGPSMQDGRVLVQQRRLGDWVNVGIGDIVPNNVWGNQFNVPVSKKVKRGTKFRVRFLGNGVGLPSEWAYLRAG